MSDTTVNVLAWIFLGLGALSALLTVNAFRPIRRSRPLFFQSFVLSWLLNELTLYMLFWQLVATAVFIALGVLEHAAAWVALGLFAVSWLGMASLWARGRRTAAQMRAALQDLDDGQVWPPVPDSKLWVPFSMRRKGTRKISNIVFAKSGNQKLRLDVFLPEEPAAASAESRAPKRRPGIVQIHGGAWVIGDKREQGLPLLNHLSANGWVGFNVNYRLSPKATFPDHLVDVKRALAWIREHADEYGVDPNFIAVTGGSAGGHLATLMALTQNDPRYQPGFTGADTSVQAAIPVYGVYCFKDRSNKSVKSFVTFLERAVMKARLAEEPEKFEAASPLDQVRPSAPPFFVVHGDKDTLAPVFYAREFVNALKKVSRAPVAYAELYGAQHAFDLFYSPRTSRTVEGIGQFLSIQWKNYRSENAGEATNPSISTQPPSARRT